MSGSVRAKFYVDRILTGEGVNPTVELRAVTQEHCAENETFWKYTPSGYLQMSITNPDAMGLFEQGKQYYLDFTPAE